MTSTSRLTCFMCHRAVGERNGFVEAVEINNSTAIVLKHESRRRLMTEDALHREKRDNPQGEHFRRCTQRIVTVNGFGWCRRLSRWMKK